MDQAMRLFLDAAVAAARAAGKLLLAGGEGEIVVEKRARRDVKLEMDRRAEAEIIGVLRERFPDHAILSEECGRVGPESEYLWVVDPLDGTFNYSRRIPCWCTSVGLLRNDAEIVGVIFDPSRNELFSAVLDGEARLNGRPARVSEVARLSESVIAVGLSPRAGLEEPTMQVARQAALLGGKARSLGSAALDLAYVACGRFEAYVEYGVNRWDIAAGVALTRAAGGAVSLRAREGGSFDIAASNGGIHDELLEAVGWGGPPLRGAER